MKKFKVFIEYLIVIILTLITLLYISINLITTTVLNKDYILKKLEETNYYTEIATLTTSNFKNFINQSGLEENIFEDIEIKDKVEKDTKTIISNIYEGKQEKISTEDLKETLNKKIENTLGIVTQEQRKSIDEFVKIICDEYKQTISSYFEIENSLHNFYKKVIKYIEIIKIILFIIFTVFTIVLILLCKEEIYKFFVIIGTTAMSTGIFFIITNIFINLNLKIDNILILNNSFSKCIINILKEILIRVINYGIIALVLGILITIISILVHYTKRSDLQHKK